MNITVELSLSNADLIIIDSYHYMEMCLDHQPAYIYKSWWLISSLCALYHYVVSAKIMFFPFLGGISSVLVSLCQPMLINSHSSFMVKCRVKCVEVMCAPRPIRHMTVPRKWHFQPQPLSLLKVRRFIWICIEIRPHASLMELREGFRRRGSSSDAFKAQH